MSANAFTSLLIDLLAKVIPAADQTAGRVIATELLQSMQPADSREAAMAVQAIAASFAALDGFARAARPGISDETAIRLRGSALTAARFAVRLLQPLVQPADPSAPCDLTSPRESRMTFGKDRRKSSAIMEAVPGRSG